MTDKEAIDRLNGVNLSLKQKQAIIDVIKNINNNDSNKEEDIPLIGVINKDVKKSCMIMFLLLLCVKLII